MATGKRRPNREGSIWQRQDGRWTGAAYVLTTSGVFKRAYVYGLTRDEVHGKLVRLQSESARGIPRPDRAWKVGEYLDYWLAEVAKPAVRVTTYAKYETMVRLYLRPGLGRHRLDRLTVATVQAFFNVRLAAGDSVAKVPVMRVVLGRCGKNLSPETSPGWRLFRQHQAGTADRGHQMKRASSCRQPVVIRSMPRSFSC